MAPARAVPALNGKRERPARLEAILGAVDPRLRGQLVGELSGEPAFGPVPDTGKIALVGHRAAGKSRLLPLLCRWTGLPGLDLDTEIERRTRRGPTAWLATDPRGFRVQERRCFAAIRGPVLIATGGGFLSHHPDLLEPAAAVLVPVTFETYR